MNESELINDEIYFKVLLPWKNSRKIGVNLHTEFTNNLDKEFDFYFSRNILTLETNIDSKIKKKVNEIINNSSAEYKDFPNYYKIGKFVNSYLQYNISYVGKELSPLEIFEGRTGVCEHYTILYNVMLNAIGIKTVRILGYVLGESELPANENSTIHAWTGALIDGKMKSFDATWGLFEGLTAQHILKAINKGCITRPSNIKQTKKTHNLSIVDILS